MQEFVIDEIEKYLDEDKNEICHMRQRKILAVPWTMQQEETVILDI